MAKNILKELRLNEISAVDFPAQEGARMTIMKRGRPEAVVKGMYSVAATAATVDTTSFAELLAANEAQRQAWEANEILWPLFSALNDALSNAARDPNMDAPAKIERIRQSVEEFMNSVADKIPDVEQELEKAVLHFVAVHKSGDPARQKEIDMAGEEAKKIADLEKTVADLTKANADIVKAKDAEIAALTKAKDEAAKDEIIKVGDVELKKSAVGEATFAVIKAQQADIAKERDARELMEFTKRVETEFPSLPGEPVAKAKVLKAIAKLEKADGDALTVMLKSGEEAMKARMRETGQGGGGNTLDDAEARMNKMASDLAEKESISVAKAHDKLSKSSAEYQKAYGEFTVEKARRAKAA